MSIVIQATSGSGINAYICHDNLLRQGASVIASSEAVGFEADRAYDWLGHTWWKPAAAGTHTLTLTLSSAKTANYFAVANHDLGAQNATVKLQYSLDGGSTWLDATASEGAAAIGTKVLLLVFPDISASKWRVQTVSGGTPSIGNVSFGRRVQLPHGVHVGFSPPNLNRENEIINATSEGGAFIGRSVIRKGSNIDLSLRALAPAWVRNTWEPFVDHAEMFPFFFGWDVTGYPWESALCWSESIESARYDEPKMMSAGFKARAILK